jgi:hypothetical protein
VPPPRARAPLMAMKRARGWRSRVNPSAIPVSTHVPPP